MQICIIRLVANHKLLQQFSLSSFSISRSAVVKTKRNKVARNVLGMHDSMEFFTFYNSPLFDDQ